jgi:ABC-2 type transport system ATP-binding protein
VDAPAIRTAGLGKRYGTVDALHDLDLEIAPGEVVGYLGPNGAGKTTTIRLLLGPDRAHRRRAEIFGLDCQPATPSRRTAGWPTSPARRTCGRR